MIIRIDLQKLQLQMTLFKNQRLLLDMIKLTGRSLVKETIVRRIYSPKPGDGFILFYLS